MKCVTTIFMLQCLQVLKAEYPNKDRGLNQRTTYNNPWTPTYLTVIRAPTKNQFPQNPNVIYIQTQLIYFNTGYPVHNPPNSNELFKEKATTVSTLNRFGEDYDEPPVWETYVRTTTPPTRHIPTRRGLIPRNTFPPIIRHETTTVRNEASKNSLYRTKLSLEEAKPVPKKYKDPSRCVWAIISCCSTSTSISYQCFEHLGCIGAFWDHNPCDSEFAQSAVLHVMDYYQTK